MNKAAAVAGNGAWAPACVTRGGLIAKPTWVDTKYEVPMGTIYTAERSIENWFLGVTEPEKYKHIDTVFWPNNKPCSNIQEPEPMLRVE